MPESANEPQTTSRRTMWERAAIPLNGLAAGVFGALSAVRGKRVFHPDGDAYRATLTFLPGDDLDPLIGFAGARSQDAIVRFSRGVGLPEAAPDVLGLAVKLPDFVGPGEDQDFLLVTSSEGPVLQNVLRPARGFFRGSYSTVLPYRDPQGENQILFGARPDPELEGSADRTFRDVAAAAAVGRLRFDFLSARLGRTWEQAGVLVVTGKLDDVASETLTFNPWNSHPDLIPAGPLNEWRKSAYEKSQASRPDG